MSAPPQNIAQVQSSPEQGQGSAKRRRVALACRSCRDRKVRCDGAQPVCGSCQRRANPSQQCEYLVVADTAKYQTERAYIQSLHDHITHMKDSVTQPPSYGMDVIDHPMVGMGVDHVGSVPGTQSSDQGQSATPLQPRNGPRQPVTGASAYTDAPIYNTPPSSVSAMGAAVPDTDLNRTDRRDEFYGQSSIVSLMRQCSQPPASQGVRQSHPTHGCNAPIPALTPAFDLKNSLSLLSDDFSLPPRNVADSLLDVYFTNVHIFYPWVHKPSFVQSYNLLWSSRDNQSPDNLPDVGVGGRNCPLPVFHCALNAMFALACEFSEMMPTDKRAKSLIFYERMRSLANIDVLDSGSLANVQALLLMAMYVQCTPYPKRCWNVVGMAYRMSVGLGLHLSGSSNELTMLEKEMRWRSWCACVQMDIIVSMTMGRPAMTSSHLVPLPSPTDDQYLAMGEQGTEQPEAFISANQFLFENMRLIGLLAKILFKVYRSSEAGSQADPRRTPISDVQTIMDLDHDLDAFEQSLYPALHWRSYETVPQGGDPTFRRQSNVLHARYLHLKLLLYRPAFSEHCAVMKQTNPATASRAYSRSPGSSWPSLFRANCAERCVRSACDLVDSLHKATAEDATGAWWYGVYYLVTAGIILIFADLGGVSFDTMDRTLREDACCQCLRTLHHMVDAHPLARDYALALNEFRQRRLPTECQDNGDALPPRPHPTLSDARVQGSGLGMAPLLEKGNSLTSSRNLNDGDISGGLGDALSPLFQNWESGVEDIMLPAQLLQEIDSGLLLPTLF